MQGHGLRCLICAWQAEVCFVKIRSLTMQALQTLVLASQLTSQLMSCPVVEGMISIPQLNAACQVAFGQGTEQFIHLCF